MDPRPLGDVSLVLIAIDDRPHRGHPPCLQPRERRAGPHRLRHGIAGQRRLALVAAALGPYLSGLRTQGRINFQAEGLYVLYRRGPYERSRRNQAIAAYGCATTLESWLGMASYGFAIGTIRDVLAKESTSRTS
jgi:hypothetical protein